MATEEQMEEIPLSSLIFDANFNTDHTISQKVAGSETLRVIDCTIPFCLCYALKYFSLHQQVDEDEYPIEMFQSKRFVSFIRDGFVITGKNPVKLRLDRENPDYNTNFMKRCREILRLCENEAGFDDAMKNFEYSTKYSKHKFNEVTIEYIKQRAENCAEAIQALRGLDGI